MKTFEELHAALQKMIDGKNTMNVPARENKDADLILAQGIKEHEEMSDKLRKILQWAEAYPLDVFPEPDFKKAAKVLKDNGITLDAISASNMRHVLSGIKNILDT